MDIQNRFKLNPNITDKQLKDVGFRKFGSHSYSYKCWIYKTAIQLKIEIDLEEEWYGFQIYDTDTNDLYTPYYDRTYGINDIVKILDKKVSSVFKELNKENIFTYNRRKHNGKKIARFSKVSYEEFKKAMIDCLWAAENDDEFIHKIYENIKLPERKTSGSAGHDFHSPVKFTLAPGQTVKIPTGIRCKINNNYVMLIFPRSSLGIKKKMQILNTIPVIDADYFFANNEGHILICIKNNGREIMKLKQGDAFIQGVFLEYGITEDDNVTDKRIGGIGSTSE